MWFRDGFSCSNPFFFCLMPSSSKRCEFLFPIFSSSPIWVTGFEALAVFCSSPLSQMEAFSIWFSSKYAWKCLAQCLKQCSVNIRFVFSWRWVDSVWMPCVSWWTFLPPPVLSSFSPSCLSSTSLHTEHVLSTRCSARLVAAITKVTPIFKPRNSTDEGNHAQPPLFREMKTEAWGR